MPDFTAQSSREPSSLHARMLVKISAPHSFRSSHLALHSSSVVFEYVEMNFTPLLHDIFDLMRAKSDTSCRARLPPTRGMVDLTHFSDSRLETSARVLDACMGPLAKVQAVDLRPVRDLRYSHSFPSHTDWEHSLTVPAKLNTLSVPSHTIVCVSNVCSLVGLFVRGLFVPFLVGFLVGKRVGIRVGFLSGSTAPIRVGRPVGTDVGVCVVGDSEGANVSPCSVGSLVGISVGNLVGSSVGSWVGTLVGCCVGTLVGCRVGSLVGCRVGSRVGSFVGAAVCFLISGVSSVGARVFCLASSGRSIFVCVGSFVGFFVGSLVGDFVGSLVGDFVGSLVGDFVGSLVGDFVGDFVGLFPVAVSLSHFPVCLQLLLLLLWHWLFLHLKSSQPHDCFCPTVSEHSRRRPLTRRLLRTDFNSILTSFKSLLA